MSKTKSLIFISILSFVILLSGLILYHQSAIGATMIVECSSCSDLDRAGCAACENCIWLEGSGGGDPYHPGEPGSVYGPTVGFCADAIGGPKCPVSHTEFYSGSNAKITSDCYSDTSGGNLISSSRIFSFSKQFAYYADAAPKFSQTLCSTGEGICFTPQGITQDWLDVWFNKAGFSYTLLNSCGDNCKMQGSFTSEKGDHIQSSSLVSCGSYTGDQKPNVAVLNNDLKTASAQYLHSTQVKNGSFTGYSIVEAKKTTMNLSADKRVIKKVGEPVILTWSVENSLLSTIGGGGDGRADRMEEAVDEGGCNSVWDIINAECSPLDILNKITPQNNFANSFINLSNNLFAKIKSIFMQPTIAQTASQPVVFLFVGNAACHPEGDASDCDFAPNSYYPVLTNSGSLTVYPQSDTNFYLIVYGISGEGPKFFVSEPLEVSIEEDEQEEGRVDLKVKEDSSGHDYTDGPITISRGADISLKWSGEENLDSCIATASPENSAWQGKVATTGTKTIYGVTNSVIFKLDCTLKNGNSVSDSVTVNVVEPPVLGTIEVKARLFNGSNVSDYTGPVKYTITGPQSLTGETPQSFSVSAGTYTLTYVSGGPNDAVCITHPQTKVVTARETTTFYLDFEVQNLCSISVDYQVPGSTAEWDGKASYVLIGPTILTGNSLPYSFNQIPPGVYYISYISGAPENLIFSGVLEGNGQVCYPKEPLQFTLQFAEPGATPPVPLPSPEIGDNPPSAKIGCAADNSISCTGTIDGDANTPTITLYNASTDPDRDIKSCTWIIQKTGGEPISKNTCQPVSIYDDTGSYGVTLTVTDSRGNTDSAQLTATVKNVTELIAKFVWDPQIPTVGKEVKFYDRSLTPSGTSLKTWLWSFEDGSPATSTSPNPEVIFGATGPKAVTLTVTNNVNNRAVITQTVDVRNIAPQWKEVIPK